MIELKVGDKAPDFDLYDNRHHLHHLMDFLGKNIVLYFYPKDDTPGCTQEACDFRDYSKEFSGLNAVIIGISKDNESSHSKFMKKYGLPFLLLADPETQVLQKYGVWKEKSLLGRIGLGTSRTTFLIDAKGFITEIYPDVKVSGHVAQVLADLKEALFKPVPERT